jgi:hypothetical protein
MAVHQNVSIGINLLANEGISLVKVLGHIISVEIFSEDGLTGVDGMRRGVSRVIN